ncbi:MAG: N-acetyltransferase [Candidatus Omnitrophica bacterium]|nr:N-acetyltransferase [Candidatus Omnitrophota bacterium]
MSDQIKIHPSAIVETGQIGSGTRVWAFVHIQEGAQIGADCNICDHSYIEKGVKLGDRVTVKNGVTIYEGVEVGDDVFIGPNAAFTNDLLPISRSANFTLKKTFLSKGVSVGANATIVCDTRIGQYAFVGAGSVVTKDVGDFELVIGNPAKFHSYICVCRNKIDAGSGSVKCSCGRTFTKTDEGLKLND